MGRLLLPGALVLSGIFALIPARWSGWVGELSRLVIIPTAPISRNVLAMSRSVLSPPEPPKAEELKLLEERKQEFETLYLRERAETQRLREMIRELQLGLSLNPEARVQQLVAPVIGTSADLSAGLLSVRTGPSIETDRTTVATTTGLQLVGRVTSSSGPTCFVMPITRRSAGKIQVAIMTGEGPAEIGANLVPVGDGTLKGDVLRISGDASVDPGAGAPAAAVGQIVRLDDMDWPKSARMLIVGRVESVSPSPSDPLRQVIVVRPTVNIERLSELLLRLQAMGGVEGAAR
jgi:cell shape-determining protein MreC